MAATGYEIDINLRGPSVRGRGLLLATMPRIPDEAYAADADRGRRAGRWPLGVTWLPWGTGNIATAASDCDTTYNKTPRELPSPIIQPAFLLYDSLTCSTLGPSLNMLAGRVRQNLEVYASAAFAAELETATASGGIGLVGDATYVPAVATASAQSLTRSLLDLEEHLADVLHGGEGVIHLTPGLLVVALSLSLVEFRDGAYRTATGHVVVGDAGHAGTQGPQSQSNAAAGQAWIYATSQVFYDVSAVFGPLDDPTSEGNSQVYIGHNDNRPLGERHGVLAFDPSATGAALVTLPS